MTTIKIFLASSVEELSADLEDIAAFIHRLNKIYVKRGIYFELHSCKELNNSTQEKENQEIRDSQYFYLIFGRTAERYAVEDFDEALAAFRKNDEPLVFTYFRELPEGEKRDQSVLEFMHRLEIELQHYFARYTHIDSVKMNMIVDLVQDPRVDGKVTLEDGQARLDGTAVLSMDNIPLYSRNEAVQELLQEQRDLQEEFAVLAGMEDNDSVQRQRLRNSKRRNEIAEKLHAMEKEVLGLCCRIEGNRRFGKKLNWREKKALELADEGNYEAAKNLLRDEEWQAEVSRAEETIAGAKEIIREYISGKKALIQMIGASGVTKHNEQEIIGIFENICALAQKHLVEVFVLYDYAFLLSHQNRISKAIEIAESLRRIMKQADIPLQKQAMVYDILGYLYSSTFHFREAETEYLRAKEIREKLVEENSAAYLPDLAYSYNNLGVLFKDMSRFQEAETEYLRAKEIREKLAEENPAAYLWDLSSSCYNLGNLYCKKERFKEAKAEYLRTKEIREKLAEENPVTYLSALAIICNSLGALYNQTSHFREAEKEYMRAIEIYEKLAEENPTAYLPGLAISCNNIGYLYSMTFRYQKAEAAYLRSKEICLDLAEHNPIYLESCINVCINLGKLYRMTGRAGEAKKEKAIEEDCKRRLAELSGGER